MQIKDSDFLLVFSFRDYPKWTSAYSMGQYALLNKIDSYFDHLDELILNGLLETETKGQMPFYRSTLKGKRYVLEKFTNFDWNKVEMADRLKNHLKELILTIRK